MAGLILTVDWPRLLLLAEEHGVVGHVAASLRNLDRAMIPPEIAQALAERQRAQVIFSLRITAELFRVLERFASTGISALVVKGPVLSVRAYGDPAMRIYGDLDLLVRHRDIRCATESMIAAGYSAKVPISAIDAGKIPGQYLFHKRDLKLLVELHNDRTLRYFPRRLPIEEFFERQIRVPLDSHDVPALSAEDDLVLICIHGAKHFWERLLWIADVAALVTRQSGIDWECVAESAKEVGAERMLCTGLRLATDLLKARLPDHVSATVKSDRVAGRLARRIDTWLPAAGYASTGLFERVKFRLSMRGNLLAAPAYLLRLSLSPTEEDWSEGSEGRWQSFLEAMRRPFRLARKYKRHGRV
ncbi:MAG TPA: nucleotidyltransferase family protein [Candidatus Acidoferrum sp.]|nr:nucleotidyltransferase family protein [Candidatus Acidoferrum sp.]